MAAYDSAPRTAAAFDPTRPDGLATRGLDPPKSNWALPLREPPFSAYAVTGGLTFTLGGIRIDDRARVLDPEGEPVPDLYAAGADAGGIFTGGYGSGLAAALVFGRIAAETACG